MESYNKLKVWIDKHVLPIEIEGKKYTIENFSFVGYNKERFAQHHRVPYCESCRGLIELEYCKIITALIEAKLLPKNYPYLCCGCWFRENQLHKSSDKELGD